ncbi:SlyX family protein [Acidovorax sp. NCPPB 2350]|nr:SlyX family protein [Acidovorax sp. NCPPB 2350]
MPDTPTPSQRIDELEIKASYAEDLLDQLNVTVYRQQQQIDALQRALAALRQQLPEASGAPARNLRDEIPPHY